MILYALQDKDTELYVTRRGRFDELNGETELFKTKQAALRCLRFNYEGIGTYSPLMNALTYSILEDKYKTNRDNLDVSYKEFLDVMNDINLCVVKVNLNVKRTKKEIL